MGIMNLLQGKSLEEQEQLIQECATAADPEMRGSVLDRFLMTQFVLAPYYETFRKAEAANENQQFSAAADYFWATFAAATSQSLRSPGRFFIFKSYLSLLLVHDNEHVSSKKEYRRLKRVIYDPGEFSVLCFMASTTCLLLPNSRYLSPERKMEILRWALLMESKLDEPFPELQYSCQRTSSVEWSRKTVTHFAQHCEALPGELAGEVVAMEEDAELFWRTSEIAGGKCDGCHKTVQELGETCLPKCGRCKFAYYCNKRCQKKGWKRCGHREVCRPRKNHAVGDVMRIRDHQHELHGRLVRLFEYAGMNDGMDDWNVTLFTERENGEDMSKVFSINSNSLVHLRPLNGEEARSLLNTNLVEMF